MVYFLIIRVSSGMEKAGYHTADASTSVTEALEAFVIGLYSDVFNVVISLINRYFRVFVHYFLTSIFLIYFLNFIDMIFLSLYMNSERYIFHTCFHC